MLNDTKTFTQADLDELNARHQEELDALSKRLNADYERKLEDSLRELREEIERKARESNMTELERTNARIKDLEARYKEKEDIIALSAQKDEARAYLKSIGVDEDDLDFIFVPRDMDATIRKADAFRDMLEGVRKRTFESGIKSRIPVNGTTLKSEDSAMRRAFGL